MTAVQWGTVLVVSIYFLATANGHTLHNGARHKSGGLGPHQSFSPKYLNNNFVGSSHSVDVGNIGGGFKSKRDEDESDVSAEDKTIDGIQISDDDDYDDDNDSDYDDEDYGDDKDYRENESDSDNEKYENEAADEDNTDGYLYDYVNDNGIANENNNGNEGDRDRFSREKKEVFGTQNNNNIPGYKEDDGHRDKNYRKDQDDGEDNDGEDDDDNDGEDDDDGGEDADDNDGEDDDDGGEYADDNDGEDDADDGDDGEVEDDEHSSALEDDNGAKAVAEYIVDYIQSPSSGEQNKNRRCLFGWRLNAKGTCVPYRKECAPGLIRSEAGDCVAPDGGHYYK